MIRPDERHALLRFARQCLEARVRGLPAPLPAPDGVFQAPAGAFVSVHCAADLRGCLGRLEADLPLGAVIGHLAAVVADSDPRFPPLALHELSLVRLEISVLGPEEEVLDVEAIEIGRHGLIVERGRARGLLLPQVAVSYGWDRETFLGHTCLKAGLPKDAWRAGVRVLAFEAQVFGEP